MAKASWCKVTPASGAGNGTVSISADPHTGREDRTTTVTAQNSSGDKPSASVAVTQEAAAAKFVVTAKTVTVAAGGGQAKITGTANVSAIQFIDGNTGDSTPTLKVNSEAVAGWNGDTNDEVKRTRHRQRRHSTVPSSVRRQARRWRSPSTRAQASPPSASSRPRSLSRQPVRQWKYPSSPTTAGPFHSRLADENRRGRGIPSPFYIKWLWTWE